MIINRLEAENFGIIGDEIDIEFPETDKIGIFGKNETGKSTLLKAVEVSLFGLKRGGGSPGESRENLVTWGKESTRLALEFSSGGSDFRVEREIGSDRGHEAKLYSVFDGSKDLIGDNVTQVESRIREITGMDRNSFEKLIYIRQDELDSLKELSKSNREELINKVMGMEEFDEADDSVREDLKELGREIEDLEKEFDSVEEKKEQFEDLQEDEEELEDEIEELAEYLNEANENLQEIEEEYGKLDWLHDRNEVENLLQEKEKNKESLEDDIDRLSELEDDLEKLEKRLQQVETLEEEFKEEYEKLDNMLEKIDGFQKRIGELDKKLEELEEKKGEIIDETDLTEEGLEELPEDVTSEKQQALMYGLIFGSIGAASILFIFMIHLAGLIGLLAFVPAYLQLRKYRKLEELSTSHTDYLSVRDQIRSAEEEREDKEEGIEDMLGDEFKNVDTLKGRKSEIEETLEEKMEVESFDRLEEKKKGIDKEKEEKEGQAEELEDKNLDEELEGLEEEIEKLEKKREELEENKPEGTDEIEYSEDKYEREKKRRDEEKGKVNGLKNELEGKSGELKRVKKDLDELEGVEEKFEKTKEQLEAKEREKRVLERTRSELKETSKVLRARVIPHAEILINNILPTLTDSRYSRLDIEEDLTFKVHTIDAGEEKERDVFSGGTQDQFLIALRLAFTQSILDSRVRAERYCLLMDESISSSDDSRKQGIFEVLDRMGNVFSQIFIIAHEDISNETDDHLVLDRNERDHTTVKSRSW